MQFLADRALFHSYASLIFCSHRSREHASALLRLLLFIAVKTAALMFSKSVALCPWTRIPYDSVITSGNQPAKNPLVSLFSKLRTAAKFPGT